MYVGKSNNSVIQVREKTEWETLSDALYFVHLKACFSLLSKLVHNFWQREKSLLNTKTKKNQII